MCRKHELKRIAELYPEVINQLSSWEKLVGQASKRQAATFFPMKAKRNTLEDYVQWAKTARGGPQYHLDIDEGPVLGPSRKIFLLRVERAPKFV